MSQRNLFTKNRMSVEFFVENSSYNNISKVYFVKGG